MKKEVYYRYLYGKKSIFSAIPILFNKETDKRFGKNWAKEHRQWTERINKKISWLPHKEMEKGVKFYFKEAGKEKYEKTLFKLHKEMLNKKKTPFKLNKKLLNLKKFKRIKKICFRKTKGNKRELYNAKTKRKMGNIVYEDRYQIGIV